MACAVAGEVINQVAGNPSKLSRAALLELGGAVLVLWAVALVLLAFAISRFNRARHAVAQERERATSCQLTAEHVERAHRLAGQLLAGETPAVGDVWDVVLQSGERVLLDGSASYSRYYGLGSPATRKNLSGSGYGNVRSGQALVDRAASRRQAHRHASAVAARWRDQQQCRVVVTDRRLLCHLRTQGWVSFDHQTATAIQTVPEKQGVVLEYPDTAPLRLSGPAATEITVIVVWALHGAKGLREHPALTEIRPAPPTAPDPGLIEDVTSKTSQTTAPAPASVLTGVSAERQAAERSLMTVAPGLDLLAFVAIHDLVLARHVTLLLGVGEPDATKQLEELVAQGLASRTRLSAGSATAYRITRHGAGRVDAGLPPPRPLGLSGYRHAVMAVGLWLTARSGTFGELQDVLTARQMRAADATGRAGDRLDTPGARFRNEPPADAADPGLGYPDLGLLLPSGGWASVDLLLHKHQPERLRARIQRTHGGGLIVGHWFFVEDQQSLKLVQAVAAELGLSDRVRAHLIDTASITNRRWPR